MALLRKTSAGQAEVSAKSRSLPPRARSLLIMIDGKRGMADLRAMLGPQVDEAAELLLREGLVEEVAPAARSGTASAPMPLNSQPGGLDSRAAPLDSRAAPLNSAPAPLSSAPAPLTTGSAPLASAPLGAPPAPGPSDWLQQRTLAARAVTAIMGPMGDDLAMRIERCKNAEELNAALRRAADLLAIAASASHAADFRARFLGG